MASRAVIGASFVLIACGSGVPDAPDAAVDAGDADHGADGPINDAAGESSGPADAGPPTPTHAPASIGFVDTDPTQGKVNGLVIVGKAADESDVLSYALYWGTSPTSKLGSAIATTNKSGADWSYPLAGSVPVGASYLLAFSANQAGEMATGVAMTPPDNFPRYVDISAGQPARSGFQLSAVVDSVNGKLLVASSTDVNSLGAKPGLFRCNLDGTGCVFVDISAGQAAHSGEANRIVLDSINSKLLVAATDSVTTAEVLGLFRCNLDGSNCSFADISAGQPAYSGWWPTPLVDTTNGKLLVVTQYGAPPNNHKPALFRCNLDGTGCAYIDISAGQGTACGYRPSAVIDDVNGKLLVVTDDNANSDKPGLFRCNLDGTACTFVDISAGQGANTGAAPSAVIDKTNGKLLVVTMATVSSPIALFRCNLDGTGCSFTNISAGQTTPGLPSAAIDAVHGKLLVAVAYGQYTEDVGLIRCNLDGTGCAFVNMAAGQPQDSGGWPSAVVDSTNNRLLVAADDRAKNDLPALYTLGLW